MTMWMTVAALAVAWVQENTDNPYKKLADDAYKAFTAGDRATAAKKARELEKAWDTTGKSELSSNPDLWEKIDQAMDAFIKPVIKEKSPDAAKVKAAYDEFISNLGKASLKGGGEKKSDDPMKPYRTQAEDVLKTFNAGDSAAAKKKARELEKAWETTGRSALSDNPDLWEKIDGILDGFIKPILKEKSPDAAKVKAACDEFIASLGQVGGKKSGDSMKPYRTLAEETLKAYNGGDKATAKKKARELEKAWDTTGKSELASNPDLWESIDQSMDAFIKPVIKDDGTDPSKIKAAYDEFINGLNKAAK
jgi:hypothetical protein